VRLAANTPFGFDRRGKLNALPVWRHCDLIRRRQNSHHFTLEQQTELDISRTLTDLGPELGAAEIRHYEPARWVVTFTADLSVDLDYDDATSRLVVSAMLGQPPVGEELAVYTLLLQVNHLRDQTGGLQMALEPVTGMVIQSYAVTFAGLTPGELGQRLGNFAAAARAWRTVVTARPDKPVDPLLSAFQRA